jgi:hypothetical protein
LNLSKEIKLTKVKAASTTATTEILSDAVDMAGYEGVIFFTTIATANAGNYLKAQQGADGVITSPADLEGSKVVAAANGEVVFLDIYKPTDRYVRASVIRGATTVVGEIYALRYEGKVRPEVNNVTNTIIGLLLVSPEEGTA